MNETINRRRVYEETRWKQRVVRFRYDDVDNRQKRKAMCLSNPTVSSTAAAVHTILRTISFAGQGGYSKSLSDAGCSDENLQVTLLAARLGSREATSNAHWMCAD